MKVHELHIENIRGIKEMDLKPEGKNFVVFGPNGTGKSAVVDALDFLFTGKISRLIGEGTSGVTLSKCGSHIDTEPKDTIVQAIIEIPDSKEKYKLKRSISNPGKLEILQGDKSKIGDVLKIATRGHHVLSRREILRYVVAQKGERAKEIQELLNLSHSEKQRQFFVSVETESSRKYGNMKDQFESAKSEILRYLSISKEKFSEDLVIKRINELRSILKGEAISVFEEKIIKKGVTPPSIPVKEDRINPDFIKSNVQKVRRIFHEDLEEIKNSEEKLISSLKRLKSDKNLLKEMQSMKLLELGISLLDESGKCPLCEKEWKPVELKKKLEGRMLSAKEAKKLKKEIDNSIEFVRFKYINLKNCLENINGCLEAYSLEKLKPLFKQWISDIVTLFKMLEKSEEKVDDIEKMLEKHNLFTPKGYEEIMDMVEAKAETEGKKLSEEQKAWDTLTKLEPLLSNFRRKEKDFRKSELAFKRAQLLRTCYEESKDKIINELYEKIKDDFVNYYKFIHSHDENNFDADFRAKGAELLFEVDFYGRGKFPPLALHSEGHQDSMGLCLYLALMKLLSEGKVNFTILDDVVMSVDSNHRRAFSKLLCKYFPDRQFFITTHNRTWAKQLQTDGIVQSKNMKEFQNWSIDTGPIYEEDVEIWSKINKFLEENNTSSAAHTLREGSEFYFNQVCEKIRAKVLHKCEGRHELGDLIPPAIKQYRKLIKKAKNSANSWGNKEVADNLTEVESIASEVFVQSQVEQWGINENVHYSKWKDFEPEDFRPIADAFKDLFDIFRCSNCGSLLYVTEENKELSNFRCNCQKVNWNLIAKKN